MLQLRLSVPAADTEPVLAVLRDNPSVGTLSLFRGASVAPLGDIVMAEVSREGADQIVSDLLALGLHHEGALVVQPVQAWASRRGFQAELHEPGSSSDAVVWLDVTQRAYDDSELSWTFLAFMTLATLIAGVGIILDSTVLIVGAMVLGPEFGAIAALGVALVQRRWGLLRFASRSLAVGFAVAILITAGATVIGRALGWVTAGQISASRVMTGFIFRPDQWSVIVAVIAAIAGVLSVTSAKTGGLSGVFISVTTIPAAANIAVGTVFADWAEVGGSLAQLGINLVCMAVTGWLTLVVLHHLRSRHRFSPARPGFRRLPGDPKRTVIGPYGRAVPEPQPTEGQGG